MRLVRYSYPSFRTLASSFDALGRSPWAGLESEIDRLFESALGGFVAPSPAQFAVDLYEDKANTYVRAELPGLSREDINVEMTDGCLTITATRKTPPPASEAGASAGRDPADSCSFSRAVSIADDVQADKVGATYENGVLTVTLPKRESAAPRKIAVAVK
ncbi:MAG: Hsp20/alpha crystallin family protein [Verrucomicrobia bacterium]|nr:Hsp20/alpha crystallin family protein [Verrucomicrobiota bacterium]